MPKTSRRRKAPATVAAAVMQPVAKRLSRIEDLLHEIRYEQDVQLKRIATIQLQLDGLTDELRDKSPSLRLVSGRKA